MKKNKTILITISALVVIVIAFGVWAVFGTKEPEIKIVKTTALAKTNLQKTISTTGQIESTYTEQVSNSTGIPIWEVDVSVGQWVEKGDRLCRLYDEATKIYTRVDAPTAGTVTAINAQNGAPASGILFTIENTNSLRVNTKIKEVDIGNVRPGMQVNIKTDATGTKEYTGTVQSIAPTAVKQEISTGAITLGNSDQNPEFGAKVSIDSDISGLLIGMKARMNIVLEEHNGVFTVPYDVLTKTAKGDSCIFVVEEKNGIFTIKEIPITIGAETDFAVEISGADLTEGMNIVKEVDKVKVGEIVTGINNGSTGAIATPNNGGTTDAAQ